MRNHWPNREGWERGDRFNGAGVGGYFFGRSSMISSIQRGTIVIGIASTSNTATITSVDTANSRIRFLGMRGGGNETDMQKVNARVDLTNATTVTASLQIAPGALAVTVSYEVTAFVSGTFKSMQRGNIGTGAGTATVTAVDTTKAELSMMGWNQNNAFTTGDLTACPILTLTNATTVTKANAAGAAYAIPSYEVAEFAA